MRAEIVSVGTELLLGQIVDTNAAELGQLFARYGVAHTHRQTVGDNLGRLTEALQLALSRAELVVTIGGLGPTEDDLTRDGIAAALADHLVEDAEILAGLRAMFAERGLPWVESLGRQALRPSCARPLDNPNGTAPGIHAEKDGKHIVALPGPRNEFIPMVESSLAEILARLSGGIIASRTLRVIGLGESRIEEIISDLLVGQSATIAPYAKVGEVHLRITAQAENQVMAEAAINPLVEELYARLGDSIYAEGELSLPQVLIASLAERGQTVATAESCTAGLVAAALTGVEGSSQVVKGGVVTYTGAAKTQWLGVESDLLVDPARGAISAECAQAMAAGARKRWEVDYAVAVTGIAGSAPYQENGVVKPNGLVYIAVAGPGGDSVVSATFRGNRETIRGRAVMFALDALRRAMG
jgi:nicotinamide-nucleotide amidase